MTFHTAPQFHATISHYTLFFTTPFCTTSHSVVHPRHRHSISYHIPFYITPYNKYISSVVSFNSAPPPPPPPPQHPSFLLWTLITLPVCVKLCAIGFVRVCVSSGHILHHKCCSVHVISRVPIAFHASQLLATLNFFTAHIIPSHQTYILHHTTFHVSHTIPHHTGHSSHITPPLHIPHHITTYMCSTPHLADF